MYSCKHLIALNYEITVPYAMQASRRALKSFQEDPETTVFLLALGAAAAGLTLTRANHVFLLEPAIDPAIEQQAVARVHRMGQERPVSIVRLLVQDTVKSAPRSTVVVTTDVHHLFCFIRYISQGPPGIICFHSV